MYEREELEELYKEQLCRIGEYLGVEVDMRMLKEEIIEAILEYEDEPEVVEVVEDLPPASVRIQRIRESNKE
jgi:hypothetical protein